MKETETHYYVKSRMDVDESWRVTDWVSDKELLTSVLEERKKTYRYTLVVSYEARVFSINKQQKAKK